MTETNNVLYVCQIKLIALVTIYSMNYSFNTKLTHLKLKFDDND